MLDPSVDGSYAKEIEEKLSKVHRNRGGKASGDIDALRSVKDNGTYYFNRQMYTYEGELPAYPYFFLVVMMSSENTGIQIAYSAAYNGNGESFAIRTYINQQWYEWCYYSNIDVVRNANARDFIPAYTMPDNRVCTNALQVDTTNPLSIHHYPRYVSKDITTTNFPSDCGGGIREVLWTSPNNVVVKITGYRTDGKPGIWYARFSAGDWYTWYRPVWQTEVNNNIVDMADIPHSSKILIPIGGCQNKIGITGTSLVTFNLYFQISSTVSRGETMFTLPAIYRPSSATIALTFFTTDSTKSYCGGLSKEGIIYPDMDIPSGTTIRLMATYFR